ncbi:hypothetical protein PoB_005055200 [Plakobranchus ocellatus]|uniref:Uncharacterized protein n=1 Tax=Plakobranchus ocellatus TaxID=259542 RepID=A0AAV4BYC8_9GAST|nr:hypothetical protein PoB_005055200 [Plakobranchus ocellatus]
MCVRGVTIYLSLERRRSPRPVEFKNLTQTSVRRNLAVINAEDPGKLKGSRHVTTYSDVHLHRFAVHTRTRTRHDTQPAHTPTQWTFLFQSVAVRMKRYSD